MYTGMHVIDVDRPRRPAVHVASDASEHRPPDIPMPPVGVAKFNKDLGHGAASAIAKFSNDCAPFYIFYS